MSGVFNILSLGLGIIAILLPIRAILIKSRKAHLFSNVSLSCCVISLYCQVCEYNHRVQMEDWSALLDTSKFVVKAAFLLTAVTLILNLMLFKRRQDEQ